MLAAVVAGWVGTGRPLRIHGGRPADRMPIVCEDGGVIPVGVGLIDARPGAAESRGLSGNPTVAARHGLALR